jgi:hypothetical protein
MAYDSERIEDRAIEPHVVVTLVTQNTSLITVLGEVNNATTASPTGRLPAQPAGEHLLDVITRAGGLKDSGTGHLGGASSCSTVSSTVQQTMSPRGARIWASLTLLPPSNACVTAVTKVGFYFFGSVRAGLGNCLHHG